MKPRYSLKTTIVPILFALFAISSACGQEKLLIPATNYPLLPKNGSSIADFTPNGWKIEIEKQGDLNGDGLNDAVVLFQENNPANIIENNDEGENTLNTNPRILAVLFAENKGGYLLMLQNHDFIPRITNPDVYDCIEEDAISIKRGAVQISLYSASSMNPRGGYFSYTFRYQNKRFELIGFDSAENISAGEISAITSVNFSTRKIKYECLPFDSDTGGKVTWGKLPSSKVWSIDDIHNGLSFDIGVRRASCIQ